MPLSRLGALLLATALGFGAGAVVLPGAASATPSEEACFLAAINAARTGARVAPLSTSSALGSVARAHSQQMASAAKLFHNPDLANEAPAGWVALAENVGAGATCDAVAQLIANDPAHRDNMLDPRFDAVGVGVVDAAGGTLYATEDFLSTGAAPPAALPITGPPTVVVPALPAMPVGDRGGASSAPAVVTSKAVRPAIAGSDLAVPPRGTGAAGTGRIPIATPIVVAEPASPPASAPASARGILAPVVRDLSTFFTGLP